MVPRFRQAVRLVAVVALGLTATSGPRSVATAAQPAAGQDAVVTVQSEEYPPSMKAALDNREPAALKRVYSRDSIPNSVTLPPVTGAPPLPVSDSLKGRLRVGFSRDIPVRGAASLRSAALIWDAVEGGSVTAVSVASPGAVAMRLAVAFGSLPAGTEARFFGPGGDSQVFGPVTAEQMRALTVPAGPGESGVFWSPVVPGDTAGMEIFVPRGLEPDLSFTIPRVSHHYRSVESTDKAAGSCNIDVACHSASWGAASQATARIAFISEGDSFVCTGTLLNDTDTSTFIPYFMTADHCINTQAEASTINSYWNYQRTTCGGAVGSFTTLFGGATLLSRGFDLDHSFLRLNDPAPASARFSGWSSGTVSAGTSMVGIHHPGGDVKKISFGVIDGIAGYGEAVTGSGGFIRVHWTAGVTEGGSSGSGLITGSYPNDRFVGTLTGGASSCSFPADPDWYGRFDLVYPLISAYLSPAVPPSAVTGAANAVSARGATLNGTANPNGLSTSAFFQYGLTPSYGSSTLSVNLGAGSAPVAIGNGAIVGLACNTLYHFRAVATSAGGTTTGADATFTTSRCNPSNGDLDADGKTDLGVYRTSTGTWHVLRSSSNYTTALTQQWGASTDLPVPGDYDGDGKMDLGVYRPSSGHWFLLKSSTNYTTAGTYQWGTTGDIPLPGDYDGDGSTDIAVYRPSNATWYILKSSTNFTAADGRVWGASGDRPVPGDYDRDGKIDLAVYRPSTGHWFILLSTTNYTTWLTIQWGSTGDVMVPADYDGDQKMDIAVYRPSNGTWYIATSSSGYTVGWGYAWGGGADVPVPADYDGDGRADIAVYRPSSGHWFLLLSSTNYTTAGTYQWGGSVGDLPVSRVPQ
jgi:hypothetical protein